MRLQKKFPWITIAPDYSVFERLIKSAFPRQNGNMMMPRNFSALQASYYGLVYTCIDEISKAIINAPTKVYARISQTEKRELPHDHWAVKWVNSASPVYTVLESKKLTYKWVAINGNSFIYTPTFGRNYPLQQWVLDPTRVRIIMGNEDDVISGYEYRGQQGIVMLPENEVLHIRTLEPSIKVSEQLLGIGIINAVLENANIDAEIRAFLTRYFANDARPPNVIQAAQPMDPTRWELFRDEWNKRLPNNKISAQLGNMDVKSLAGSAINVDYDKVHESNRQQISEIFGLPLDLLNGKLNGRATADAIVGRFLTNTVNPILRLFDSFYTKHIQRFDPNLVVESDYYVDSDPNEVRAQELHELTTGQTTINELLRKKGRPPVKNGDIRFMLSGVQTLDNAVMKPAPLPVLMSNKPVKKFPINIKKAEPTEEETKLAVWKSFDAIATKSTVTLKSAITGVFKELEQEVLSNVGKSYKVGVEGSPELFNEELWIEKIQKATGKILTKLQRAAVIESLHSVNYSDVDLSDTFDKQLSDLLGTSTAKITDSIGTIKEELRDLVHSKVGSTADEISEALKAKFSTLKESRADAIARTSATFTTASAQKSTYTDLNFETVWLSQRDGVTRPSHLEADGSKPNDEGMFTVGGDVMPCPGGGSDAAENVNCRCMLFAQKKKEKE